MSRIALGLVLAASLGVTGCAAGGTGGRDDDGRGKDLTGTLTVLAAASLTESFTDLADRFEAAHEGASVRLAFDSSATLAEQVNQGAPADVLATADEPTMQLVVDDGNNEGPPRVFATNRLELVVPADNPAGIETFADIGQQGVKYVVCVPSAPCGALAATALEESGITAAPASEEVDVKAVLNKVTLGEADAGIVYATDAVAAGSAVRGIPVPSSPGTTNNYPIVALAGSEEPDLAEAWLALVRSEAGRRVMADSGFGPPGGRP